MTRHLSAFFGKLIKVLKSISDSGFIETSKTVVISKPKDFFLNNVTLQPAF